MQFKDSAFPRVVAAVWCLAAFAPAMNAQNTIALFGPVNVRLSAAGTGFGANAVNFNSATLNLNCTVSPISAVLSSTPDSTGNVLVDNNINVTVTSSEEAEGPTNVCRGGESGSPPGPLQNCFTAGYQVPASKGTLTGQNPDTLAASGGVAPLNISHLLEAGPQQIKIDLQDEGSGTGFYLASSTIYLNTNCTPAGVTGPALVTGNPIPATNPTPAQLAQDFSFNPVTNQVIGFEYDLTQAQSANTLTINGGTIPQVGDSPLDPATWQTVWAPQTSFATSECLVHSGELLPNGQPACKLFTLECKVGTGASASGAQCPISVVANEVVRDTFDGPAFTLNDIAIPNGPTFHEGIGFLMASEGWNGGSCSFDPASGLQNLPCPQNLLSSFSGPGLYTGSGRTTHPNSTFISIAQVPEDLTTVTVAGQQPGYWINSSTAAVTLSSQPPNLAASGLPGAAAFVPSPILSITYGISPAGSVPVPGIPVATDTTLTNPIACPTPASPGNPAATVFAPGAQTLTGLADGYYLVHYFAQDCAGTEELKFTQDASSSWSTSYYTYLVNVDTAPPAVASGPTLTPAPSGGGTYAVGQAVIASFSCTDALSGVVRCGSQTYAQGATKNTGTLTAAVDTSSPGSKTFTVQAVDAAGNQSSASVTYQVVTPYDSQIRFSIHPQTVTYPQGTNVVVQVVPLTGGAGIRASKGSAAKGDDEDGHSPRGTVQIVDGTTVLKTLRLQGDGAAYDYLRDLGAGQHVLSAVYSGDAHNPAGTSAPVTLTVLPAPVRLHVACWNANLPYGGDYTCGVYASADGRAPQGAITYQLDGGAAVSVPLNWGVAQFTIQKPAVGAHTVVVSFAAQGNYAAAGPETENFTVNPAPVHVQLAPSSWYFTGGSLTLTATVQSWSAGPPNATGQITFSDGGAALSSVPVDSAGSASLVLSASSLTNGEHTFTAAYGGGANYGTGGDLAHVNVSVH